MKVTRSITLARELVLKDFSRTKIAKISLSEHFTSDLLPKFGHFRKNRKMAKSRYEVKIEAI